MQWLPESWRDMTFLIRTATTIAALVIAIFVVMLSVTRSAHCASSDPFNNYTLEVAYGPLAEKWSATINKLGRDHALFGACSDSNVTACAAARQLRPIIEDAKAQSGLAVLGHINRAVNFEIKPMVPSGWLSPLEAINGNGDCKAYSIANILPYWRRGLPRITYALSLCIRVAKRAITWFWLLDGKTSGLSLTT